MAFISQNQAAPDQPDFPPYQNGNSNACHLLSRTSGWNRITLFVNKQIDIAIYSFKQPKRFPCNTPCETLLLEPNASRNKTYPEKLVSAFFSKQKYHITKKRKENA